MFIIKRRRDGAVYIGANNREQLAGFVPADYAYQARRYPKHVDAQSVAFIHDISDCDIVPMETEPAPTTVATWYLVTVKSRLSSRSHFSESYLVRAASGADVEDTLKRHDIGQVSNVVVSWEPLDDVKANVLAMVKVMAVI